MTSAALVTAGTDQLRVATPPAWFLFVRLTLGEQSLPSESFSLDYGGRRYESNTSPYDMRSGFWSDEWIGSQRTLEPGESEWIVFSLPRAASGTSPRLVFDGTREVSWPLPSAAADRLRTSPPARRRVSVSVPDVVTADEPIPVTVTASNEQDRRGYVSVGLNDRELYRGVPVVVELGPRETRSVTHEFPNPGQYGASTARYRIVYQGGSREVEIPIRDPESSETATTRRESGRKRSQRGALLGRLRR